MTKRMELLLISFILVSAGFVRFYQLGYSHFYGDEIKTLYLRKDVSAFNFLFDQRKGPGQFIVSWVAEKVSGGYSELWIRFPYALMGTLLILVIYYFVRQNFGIRVALIASVLFSINGFYIAFSRTAQYQAPYLLFGFVSLIFAKVYFEKAKLSAYLFSALSLSISILFHYDAVFFFIPLYFLAGRKQSFAIISTAITLSMLFYIPDVYFGYFKSNTLGYLSKRFSGVEYLKNNSLYTILIYNPFYLYPVMVAGSFGVGVLKAVSKYKSMLLYWIAMPFIVFQFLLLNPGTHIHNYLISTIFISALGLDYIIDRLGKSRVIGSVSMLLIFLVIYVLQLRTFVPTFSRGYPWRTNRPSNQYHLYLYGFPYYRGWDEAGKYIRSLSGVRNFYTNDNESVSEYYVYGIPHIAPGANFIPQYYIEVKDPKELQDKQPVNKSYYIKIDVDLGPDIVIYKKVVNEKT